MARKAVEFSERMFSCSICLEILKDPVTIPCGHNYCISCLGACWDGQEKDQSCPQCRESFSTKPALVKNTMLAALVEELKRSTLLSHGEGGDVQSYAQPEEVPCDVCIGRRLKASKSCLQCLASYCDLHLQPHHDAAPLKKHKLVEPLKTLQNNICPDHNEIRKLYCRKDKQCICHICSWDKHRHHHIVYISAERSEREKEIEPSRKKIQKMVQEKSKELVELQREEEAIKKSADEAGKQSDVVFDELVSLLEKRRKDLKLKIKLKENEELCGVAALQQKLQKEISKLQKQDDQLENLSQTEDHNQFLESYLSLPQISEHKISFSVPEQPLTYFSDVTVALSALKHQVQSAVSDEWTNMEAAIDKPDVLLIQTQPESKEDFLKYSRELTMDPYTLNNVRLSENNKKASVFSGTSQILSKERLTQRCYWEVDWGSGNACVAVSYKNNASQDFGSNNTSWSLTYYDKSFRIYHNSITTSVPGTTSNRIGVYVDQKAGILSFYSVSDTIKLIHKVQTTFTQPLYAGVRLTPNGCYGYSTVSAQFCKIK